MARAYFYVVNQGPNWTVRYESRNYGMFASEAAAYSQATQWARDQGKNGHDGQVFTRTGDGRFRARWSFARDTYPADALDPPADDAGIGVSMLLRVLVGLALALILAPALAAAQDAAWGTVRICRQTGIDDVNAGKPIGIPPGATFVDNGAFRDVPRAGDTADRIRIATIEATQIAATALCTVARARISQNVPGAGLRAADNRRLSPSRAASGELAGWPGNLYLFATIASDFQ